MQKEDVKDYQKLIGRDEKNLAEFPFTLLGNKQDKKITKLTYEDEITSEGKIVKRKWEVESSGSNGLPIAFDNDVLLALLYLGKKQGLYEQRKLHELILDDDEDERTITFTRFNLCEVMKIDTGGRSYKRLEEALDRLVDVKITAYNAFWEKRESKLAPKKVIRIIEGLTLFKEKDNVNQEFYQSKLRISKELFQSIRDGHINELNLDFYFSLESAITKRLYRYLDKMRQHYELFTPELFSLAYNHLGFDKQTYKYASIIKSKLDPAHRTLAEESGILKSWEYQKSSTGKELVIYQLNPKKPNFFMGELPFQGFINTGIREGRQGGNQAINSSQGTEEAKSEDAQLLAALTAHGVTKTTARKILAEHPAEHIKAQIGALPFRNAVDPAAYLIKSIRENWTVPARMREAQEAQARQVEAQQKEQAREQEAVAQQAQIEEYLARLTPEGRAALEEEARVRAVRDAGKNAEKFYPGGQVPAYQLRGYVEDLVKERMENHG